MVMFKARFQPAAAETKPPVLVRPRMQQQQQQQQQRQHPGAQPQPERKAPPIEKERGPQVPIREPDPLPEPERVV
jgi:hypothetical protein